MSTGKEKTISELWGEVFCLSCLWLIGVGFGAASAMCKIAAFLLRQRKFFCLVVFVFFLIVWLVVSGKVCE